MGPAAITIGVLTQQADYQGRAASGRFRVTVITVREDSDGRGSGDVPWRLAGVQLSPMAAPPGGRANAGRG